MTPDQDLSAATADLAKSKPEPHWPVGLYAPGNYICICADCGKQHIAAKRALHCADCTIQRLFNRIANDADKIKAMAADHTAAVQAAVAKAVEASVNAENEACAEMLDNQAEDLEADASRFRHGTDPHHSRMAFAHFTRKQAAAIRSRGVAG